MIRFENFERLGVAVAAFTEKADGDCSVASPPVGGEGITGRQTACQTCGVSVDDLVCVRQVHGVNVVPVTLAGRTRIVGARGNAHVEADGIVTAERGLPLGILTADCVPIYLIDPTHGVGGLVHAGRQGTLDNICGCAIVKMTALFHTNPHETHALIGPSAGPCCYEVSMAIADEFRASRLSVRNRHIDLWQSNVTQLQRAGVPQANIAVAGQCTICSDRFYSYRRGADKQRNLALLVL